MAALLVLLAAAPAPVSAAASPAGARPCCNMCCRRTGPVPHHTWSHPAAGRTVCRWCAEGLAHCRRAGLAVYSTQTLEGFSCWHWEALVHGAAPDERKSPATPVPAAAAV